MKAVLSTYLKDVFSVALKYHDDQIHKDNTQSSGFE